MKQSESRKRVQELFREHEKLITRKNVKAKNGNGVYDRYANAVLTVVRSPLFWRYDFEPASEGGPCASELYALVESNLSINCMGARAGQGCRQSA